VAARVGAAGGGEVRGPGSKTSDTAGLYALSNKEFVVSADGTESVGAGFLHWVNNLKRKPEAGEVIAALGGRLRFLAGGGPVLDKMTRAPRSNPITLGSVSRPEVGVGVAQQQAKPMRVVLIDDQRDIGSFLGSDQGEEAQMAFIKRNSVAIAGIIQNV